MNTDKDKKVDLLFEDLTYKIIGAAIEVHKVLARISHTPCEKCGLTSLGIPRKRFWSNGLEARVAE